MNEDPRTSVNPAAESHQSRAPGQEVGSDDLHATSLPPDPAELHALKHDLAQEFPLAVAATELVLMDVDPTRLHAFWSVVPEDLGGSSQQTGQAKMMLRLQQLTATADGQVTQAAPTDIAVEGLQGSLYADHLAPGRAYRAELLLVAPDDGLTMLAESNTLVMPGGGHEMSPRPQQHFPPGLRLPDLKPEFPNAGEAERWQSLSLLSSALSPDADVRPDVLSAVLHKATAGNPAIPARGVAAPAILPAYLQDLPDDLPRFHLPADVIGDKGKLRSSEAIRRPTEEPGDRPVSGSYSSSSLARRDTDVELSVDLSVHGRAKPGSTIVLFGRAVVVGPDGRFSVNEPLPDELVELAMSIGRDESTNSDKP